MRDFDFYEFTGILVPGAISVFGFAVLSPEVNSFVKEKTLSVGDLGLFLILSYAGGHLIQGVGNILEKGWWKVCGGWPYDRIRTGDRSLLSEKHVEMLNEAIVKKLKIDKFKVTKDTNEKYWHGITRQMYTMLDASGKTSRIEVFNGNYGLFRGIATSLIVVLAMILFQSGITHPRAECALVLAIALAVYRMHRFSHYYSKELFMQFIQLPEKEES